MIYDASLVLPCWMVRSIQPKALSQSACTIRTSTGNFDHVVSGTPAPMITCLKKEGFYTLQCRKMGWNTIIIVITAHECSTKSLPTSCVASVKPSQTLPPLEVIIPWRTPRRSLLISRPGNRWRAQPLNIGPSQLRHHGVISGASRIKVGFLAPTDCREAHVDVLFHGDMSNWFYTC